MYGVITTVPAPLDPVAINSSAFLRLLLKIPMAATLTTIGGPGKSDRDGSSQFSNTADRSAEPTAKSGVASWQVSLTP